MDSYDFRVFFIFILIIPGLHIIGRVELIHES